MIATSHSVDVGTDQIVKGENVNARGKHSPPNRKCQLVNAKYRMNMHAPPVIVENINVAIKHIGYIWKIVQIVNALKNKMLKLPC